jgi:glycosyltransferase involved in cell wall biosynthesis
VVQNRLADFTTHGKMSKQLKKMQIRYFFRKSSPVFHSIEEQFFAVQKKLPESVSYKNIHAPYHSKGIFKRLAIALHAARRQGDVNHITGDIHFAVLFMKKSKTVLTIHDIGSALKGSGLSKIIIRLFWFKLPFARIKYLSVISEFTKNEILENFKIKPEKIQVIPDCVSDAFQYKPKTFNEKNPRILHLGTKSNKNLLRLIRALKDIPCRLIIIGKLSPHQESALEDYGIDFESHHNLPFSEIVSQYERCDMVSFVTLYEGFGVPVLEAQAVGRVLITSKRSPMKENAGNGALLANPENSAEIRAQIQRVIQSSNLREKIIKQGLENVKRFRAEAVAKAYYELYNEMRGN